MSNDPTAGIDPKGSEGAKKAPLHLLPSFPLHEAAWVLKLGADKYGEFNWRHNRVKASTYRSAMHRHLDQWFDGLEDVDSESGRSHLAHVISSAIIVLDAMKHGTLADDRPPRAAAPAPTMREIYEKILADDTAQQERRTMVSDMLQQDNTVPFILGAIIAWRPGIKATLPSGEVVEVPALPEGFDGFEVLPENQAPFSDETAHSPNMSDVWSDYHYNHYGARDKGRGFTKFAFLVAHKTPADPFAGLPPLPEAPRGMKWERIPEEECGTYIPHTEAMWTRTGRRRSRVWHTNNHHNATSRTYGGTVVYIRLVPISTNC